MSSNLLLLYHKLLREYDKILNLTDKLLYALQAKEAEETIDSLLNQRVKTMRAIQKMTLSLKNFNPSERIEPQIVEQLKSIHLKFEGKTSLLAKKEVELEKLAKSLE
ncbi:MAG TPA: hypothetical protein VMT04_02440 [Terriglobales bacterium]|nr:hypothetical protein [Terriglobales bacterium]